MGATDPLRRPWRKLCSAPSSPPGNAVEISEEEEESKRGARGRVGRVSLQDLLSSSVTSPVDDLVVKELSKIYKGDLVGKSFLQLPNSSREVEEGRSREDQLLDEQLKVASEEEQLLEEELKLVRRLNEQASGSTKIDMNVKYEFTAPSTTPATSLNANQIYFDQVLLSQLQGETSGSPVLLNLRTDSPQRHEFQLSGRGDSSPFRFTTTEVPDAETPGAVEIDARDAVSNFVATKAVIATTTTTSTTATTQLPPTSTTLAQSSSTTRIKAESRSTTTASPPRRRLSSTELLKLCFTQGIGCDFSQNEVYTNPTTEAATTTTTTTTTTRPSLSQDAKQRLKHKV